MKEFGSHDGNTHLRSRYSQGVVTPYRPEISDRSIQREYNENNFVFKTMQGIVGGL